eukprot:scaffold63313_cov69-Phaeocystis_antarctica.AAC.4
MCDIFTWVRARLGWARCGRYALIGRPYDALQGIEPLSHAEGGRMGRVALERHGSPAHGSRRKHGYSVSMATGTTTDVRPRENCIAPDIAFIVWTTFSTYTRLVLQYGLVGQLLPDG